MSQPPYPPQGGQDPGGEQRGSQGWDPPGGGDPPTERFGTPGQGQRDQTQQFAQPPYGQQPGPSGQPPYGPQRGRPPYGPPHGQPGQYGQPYGQPGQPPYGPPPGQPGQYGQPYGQPGQYGQPYGQPGPYGPPGEQWRPPGGQPPTGNKNTVIALVVAGVVVLAAVGVALWLLLGDGGQSTTASDPGTGASSTADPSGSAPGSPSSPRSSSPASSPSSPPASPSAPAGSEEIPPPAVTPEGLGADPVFDSLAQECYDGSMDACDTLYDAATEAPAYQEYADTCAGRQPAGTLVYCTDAFPGG